MSRTLSCLLPLLFAFCLGCVAEHVPPQPKLTESDPLIDDLTQPESASGPVGEVFQVQFKTTKGDFLVEVHPEWAPLGAAHFKELVEAGFYDDCRFFRVIPGFMAQFGISGDPQMSAKWGASIQDDRVVQSNVRGMLTYAKTGMPNSRSTQLFINYGDNSQLDQDRFAPFGKVVEGMSVVDQIYSGYGEQPEQGAIESTGNKYLVTSFPKLDYIITARIVESPEAAATPVTPAATTAEPANPPAAATESVATPLPQDPAVPAAEPPAAESPAAEPADPAAAETPAPTAGSTDSGQ